MSEVVELKTPEPLDPLLGPFETYDVVVDGRRIPGLTGWYEGDKICLVVDRRFSYSVPRGDAHGVAWLLANAIAVASGYPHFAALTKDRPFAPQVSELKLDPDPDVAP